MINNKARPEKLSNGIVLFCPSKTSFNTVQSVVPQLVRILGLSASLKNASPSPFTQWPTRILSLMSQKEGSLINYSLIRIRYANF